MPGRKVTKPRRKRANSAQRKGPKSAVSTAAEFVAVFKVLRAGNIDNDDAIGITAQILQLPPPHFHGGH